MYFQAEAGATGQYYITDGIHVVSGSKAINSSGQWNSGAYFGSINDSPVTASATVTDYEGNPSTINYNLIKETVGPGGSFSIGGTLINGITATNNPTLALSLAFTAPSGIATVAYSTNGGSTYGVAQAYSTTASVPLPNVDGAYTIAIRATTNAGNVTTYTKQVRLDRVGPTITSSITSPTNAGSYDVGQAVTLYYLASDPDNVAFLNAAIDGTTAVTSGVAFNSETLTPGTHSLVITATDGLGNVTTTTLTMTVHATVGGLTTAVNDGTKGAKITSSTVSGQMLSYLSSAQSALNANNHASAKSYLASFVSLVQAQSGVSISTTYGALLIVWANDLISRL